MTIALDFPSIAVHPARRSVWGIVASSGLHLVLLALLVIGPNTQRPRPALPRSIDVEMVSAAQFAALSGATEAPANVASPAPAPLVPSDQARPAEARLPPEPPARQAVRASDFYASALLAEPESAALRAGMATLDGAERQIQLCDIEAMEQVRRMRPEFDPDMVVAYAMADMAFRDGVLVAEGAAFRSRREWYGLQFRCAVTGDYSAVLEFVFTVGDFIPHELWEAHYLTAEETNG